MGRRLARFNSKVLRKSRSQEIWQRWEIFPLFKFSSIQTLNSLKYLIHFYVVSDWVIESANERVIQQLLPTSAINRIEIDWSDWKMTFISFWWIVGKLRNEIFSLKISSPGLVCRRISSQMHLEIQVHLKLRRFSKKQSQFPHCVASVMIQSPFVHEIWLCKLSKYCRSN